MAAIEFWYEFGSTYSYPAVMRIEKLAAQAGVELRWRPFLLGPIFQTLGWNDSPFNIFAAKGRYMWRDLTRICEAEGIPLKLPPAKFPQNGLKAARLALAGESARWTPSFTRAVFAANYAEQKDISEDATLVPILDALGVDAKAAFAAANTPENKVGVYVIYWFSILLFLLQNNSKHCSAPSSLCRMTVPVPVIKYQTRYSPMPKPGFNGAFAASSW